ncbi:MAG TPA: hypothetical protein VGH89_30775 [Pseudonocardia sp.]|jgi:hypothetical protein
MAVRQGQHIRIALLVASAALLSGCGGTALTTQPSVHPTEEQRPTPAASPNQAFTSTVTKLRLIAQDSCQIGPPEQVYPNCDRFLAELRSAAGTIQRNSADLPGGEPMGRTAAAVIAGAGTFDKDGCGGQAAPTEAPAVQACVTDLKRVRENVSLLLRQGQDAVSATG